MQADSGLRNGIYWSLSSSLFWTVSCHGAVLCPTWSQYTRAVARKTKAKSSSTISTLMIHHNRARQSIRWESVRFPSWIVRHSTKTLDSGIYWQMYSVLTYIRAKGFTAVRRSRTLKRKLLSLGIALFLSSVAANLAWAANFQLTSAGNNIVLDGVYISPYTALIDGVPTTVICDDFADDVSVGETWQATVSTVANLSPNVKWATNSDPALQPYSATTEQNLYNQAAWLSGQLLATSNPTQMGEISYAIWAVFDPTGVQNWLSIAYNDTTHYNAIWGVGGLLGQAAIAERTMLANSRTCRFIRR